MNNGYAHYLRRLVPASDWSTFPQTSQEPQFCSGRARILVVFASKQQIKELTSALGDFEHEVIPASTTCEAISALSLQKIDLVLLNVTDGDLSGLEFCQILKKSPATQFLPVFVVASEDDMDVEVRALEAGADEFLIRPVRARAFRARVQANLRHKAMIESLDDSETVLFSLAQSVEERAQDLGQHCHRLALMGAAMGLAMGLPAPDILALQRGGYLHDIGKVAVPDSILFKPGRLTDEEWIAMKLHPERGERICSGMKSLAPVLPIIRHHHERWDGSGYPDGLKGEEIPLLARILQLADIYDALTTTRPYKAAMNPEEAMTIIRDEAKKGWRDPKLVDMFADVLPMFRAAPAVADFSRLSLHALAAYVEGFGRDGGRFNRRSGQQAEMDQEFKLASGF